MLRRAKRSKMEVVVLKEEKEEEEEEVDLRLYHILKEIIHIG
jgi:hypothetical protein